MLENDFYYSFIGRCLKTSFSNDKSIAPNIYNNFQCVCFWLIRATWVCILSTLLAAATAIASIIVKYAWIWLMVIVYISKLADSREVFFVFCMRTARPRTLNRINNELMGKNYRFDYLHFYFANWITFTSGILDGTIKQSRAEQSKSNIVQQKSRSNRIKSLNCRIEQKETYSESKAPDKQCERETETKICNHYNGNIVQCTPK